MIEAHVLLTKLFAISKRIHGPDQKPLMQPAQLALTIAFDVSKQILYPDHEQTKCTEALLASFDACRRMTNIYKTYDGRDW